MRKKTASKPKVGIDDKLGGKFNKTGMPPGFKMAKAPKESAREGNLGEGKMDGKPSREKRSVKEAPDDKIKSKSEGKDRPKSSNNEKSGKDVADRATKMSDHKEFKVSTGKASIGNTDDKLRKGKPLRRKIGIHRKK